MAQLAMAHYLGEQWSAVTQLTAQLAHDSGGALINVDVLSHERRALAVDAAMAVGRERSNAALQEVALELLYVPMRRSHGG
jgi:hypothetical protein